MSIQSQLKKLNQFKQFQNQNFQKNIF